MSAEAHMRGLVLAKLVKTESIDFEDMQILENKAEKKHICCLTPWNN